MAAASTTTRRPGSRRGMVARFTAKAGPLPVWAWALLILVLGYLAYRLSGGGSSSSSSSSSPAADTTSAVTPDASSSGDTGSPPASGQGGPADNLNDSVLSQLTGLQGSVDALTGLVQTTPAFWPGSGDAGAGAGGELALPHSTPLQPAATRSASSPRGSSTAPAHVRYYTFAPGKAPKNKRSQEAPARGPAGTTLHFKRGKGYYYA